MARTKIEPPQVKDPLAASAVSGDSAKQYSARKLCLFLAVISFAVYANTLQNGFVLDDATVMTRNTMVMKGFAGIPEILTSPRLAGFESSNDAESYRPVPLVLHAIEYQLCGPNATVGHLVNILLFAGCVVALFLFLRRLLCSHFTAAFVCTLLFALHPIHTEVVANIKSSDELLCFLFAFMSLSAFARFAGNGSTSSAMVGVILMFLSLLSKETSIVFIAVVPFIFFTCIDENRRRSFIVTILTVVAALAFWLVRAAILGGHHANNVVFLSNPLVAAEGNSRIATAMLVLGMYLKLLFIPYPLVCDYSYNSIPTVGFGDVYAIISSAVLISLIGLGVLRFVRNRRDPWAFAIFFFICSIFLFSNIAFLVYSEMAERFLFFPSVGFCLVIGLAVDKIASKQGESVPILKNKMALAVLIPLCLVYFTETAMRNAEWKDNSTLFSSDLKNQPEDCELNYYMAAEFSLSLNADEPAPADQVARDKESISYLNKAISIYPGFEMAHAALGTIYDRLYEFDSAIMHDREAIRLNPKNSIATYNLGRAYFFKKNYSEGIRYFRKTLDMKPDYMMGLLNLASCYTADRQYDSALAYYSKALVIDPAQPIARKGIIIVNQMRAAPDTTARR